MLVGNGRITLAGHQLIRTVHGERQEGERQEQELPTAQHRLDAYREQFGVTLTAEQLSRLD